ncbi:hypothetical protein [Agitococcus lubricus]|uniref:Uncharacterized protein n=1 Tax=Agitococcus lubricus TaxID=1077255 RepID=A0A2T5IYK3_9GAMM|nr:hypothetical protein [Agitococcus lubricus]PTQ89071.1 hypothetical protein C8N29_10992 [Agitococcus lubricus]
MSQYQTVVPITAKQNVFVQSTVVANRIVRQRKPLLRDLRLVLTHASELPWLFFPLKTEKDVHPELLPSSYPSYLDYFSVIAQMVVPTERKSVSYGTLAVIPHDYVWPEEKKQSKWFFINGICTSPAMALLEAREMVATFQRPIHLIHTPTAGVVRDLWGAITARTLRKDGRLSRPAFNIVKNALLSHEKVVLTTYSQGTIVASYIVRKVLKDPILRLHAHKLEVYCIGGAADSLHIDHNLTAQYGRSVPYVEHFANGKDFFARVGVLAHYHDTSGAIFVIPNKKGHMLNDHYLKGIGRGDYCDQRSRLYRYANGGEAGTNDYIPPDRRR